MTAEPTGGRAPDAAQEGPIMGAVRLVGESLIFWREQAESMERQRNVAFAEIDALTVDLAAAREALAALREQAGNAVAALKLAQERAGKPDPSYIVLDVTRNTREDLQRALAATRPDEPKGEEEL